MVSLVQTIKDSTMLKWNRFRKFQAKVQIFIELGPYILKTAEGYEELIESFRLRHEVFFQEFQGLDMLGLDFDRYDRHFDHLIIVHKKTNKIVGTYRLNCSKYSSLSYTDTEFDIKEILEMRGPHIELGRACIHKEHRKGTVISLLWRGIAEYMNLTGAQILFGCSSLKIHHPREAALTYAYLVESNQLLKCHFSYPRKNFLVPDFNSWYQYFHIGLNDEQRKEAEDLLPPLLKSYLKLGAKIASEPAFDKDFNCVDMLTVLKKDDLVDSLAKRFKLVE